MAGVRNTEVPVVPTSLVADESVGAIFLYNSLPYLWANGSWAIGSLKPEYVKILLYVIYLQGKF